MLEYNEKNQSLALIIVCKIVNSLCNFLGNSIKNSIKIIGEMLSTFGQPQFDCHGTSSMDVFVLITKYILGCHYHFIV